jgi:hypothetical protein
LATHTADTPYTTNTPLTASSIDVFGVTAGTARAPSAALASDAARPLNPVGRHYEEISPLAGHSAVRPAGPAVAPGAAVTTGVAIAAGDIQSLQPETETLPADTTPAALSAIPAAPPGAEHHAAVAAVAAAPARSTLVAVSTVWRLLGPKLPWPPLLADPARPANYAAPKHRQHADVATGTAITAAVSAITSGASVTHPQSAAAAASTVTAVIVLVALPRACTSDTAVSTGAVKRQQTAVTAGTTGTTECGSTAGAAVARYATHREDSGVTAGAARASLAAGVDGVPTDSAVAAVAPKYATIATRTAHGTQKPKRHTGIAAVAAIAEEAGGAAVTAGCIGLRLNAVTTGAAVARHKAAVASVTAGPVVRARNTDAAVTAVTEPAGGPTVATVEPVSAVAD